MEITLSDQFFQLVPNYKIGIIHYNNIRVEDSPQMLKGRLRFFQESLAVDLLDKNVTDLEGIAEWRKVIKSLGGDPSRYRHSAEALYRRVKKQQFIPTIHSAADVNNFFSLKYEIPTGIYDCNKISGDVTLRIGNESDEYLGLNGRMNHLKNLPLSSDQVGAFGSLFVDSERTAVTKETSSILQIVYIRPSFSLENAEEMLKSLQNMFLHIHGGFGECFVLHKDKQVQVLAK